MEPKSYEEILKTRRDLEEPRITLFTKTNLCRILKTILFVLCVAGFSYQASEFVEEFYKYPSVIDIQVKQPLEYPEPAFTFCNWNRVKRSKYCAKYPDNCEHPSNMESFCAKHPHYCDEDITNFTIPKAKYLSDKIPMAEIQELGHDVYDFLLNKAEDFKGPLYFTLKGMAIFFPCYTYNAHYESSSEPKTDTYSKPDESIYTKTLWEFFFLDIEVDEVFQSMDEPGALMAIHSPFEAVDPYLKSIHLTPGKKYVITLRIEEQHLLPYPYQTDCIDYNELWMKNNKTGPRSQMMCINLCQVQHDLACYGCATEPTIYTHSSRFCTLDQLVNAICYEMKHLKDTMTQCKSKCKKECTKVNYHYTFEEMNQMNILDLRLEPNLIDITVYTDGAGIPVMTYKPQYKTVEFFSYIGGFMGMWLGISIWAMTGYISPIFYYIKEWCQIYKSKSNVCVC